MAHRGHQSTTLPIYHLTTLPPLLTFLHERQIHLEVNPTSNVCLGVYDSLEQHPFIHLLRMGLCVTVNSDDPPLFNTTLTQEYQRLAETFGLDESDLQRLTLNAVRSTFLPAEEKRRMEEEFDIGSPRKPHSQGLLKAEKSWLFTAAQAGPTSQI